MATLAEILRTGGSKCRSTDGNHGSPPRYDNAWTNSSQNHVGSSGRAVNPATANSRRKPDGRWRSAWITLAARM